MRFSASRQRSGAHDGSKFAEKFRDETIRVCGKVTGKWLNGDRKYTSAEIKKFIKNFLCICWKNAFGQFSLFGTDYRC